MTATAFPVITESFAPLAGLAVPAQLLLHIAKFASTDDSKPAITGVRISWGKAHNQAPYALTIAAVDGHRAFRFRIPAGHDLLKDWDEPTEDFQAVIDAAILRKIPAAARSCHFTADASQLVLSNGKGSVLGMQPVAKPGMYGERQFPNLDQLWPESFHYEPKRLIGINAGYMADVLKAISKLSSDGVSRMHFNHPTTPIVFEAKYMDDPELLLEFLVMPVLVRDFN